VWGAEPPVPPGVSPPDGCVEPLSADGRASVLPGLQEQMQGVGHTRDRVGTWLPCQQDLQSEKAVCRVGL
jgi:hypothetical protein